MEPSADQVLRDVDGGDKYRVVRKIGSGGMATVFAVEHLRLHTTVALKLLLPSISESASRRFAAEAKALSRLKSRHTVKVHDVGELEGFGRYIEMELLAGRNLATAIQERIDSATQTTSPSDAALILLQACESVQEAHSHGIIHRDLKPANLFLSADGQPLHTTVLDFGIAKVRDRATLASKPNQAIGTVLYMAPEQCQPKRGIDERCDIWGLGSILYELLAGVPPVERGTIIEVLATLLDETPLALPHLDRLPPALAKVAKRCLEKDRELRYPNVAALVEDLKPMLDQRATRPLRAIASCAPVAKKASQPRRPPTIRMTPNDEAPLALPAEATSLPVISVPAPILSPATAAPTQNRASDGRGSLIPAMPTSTRQRNTPSLLPWIGGGVAVVATLGAAALMLDCSNDDDNALPPAFKVDQTATDPEVVTVEADKTFVADSQNHRSTMRTRCKSGESDICTALCRQGESAFCTNVPLNLHPKTPVDGPKTTPQPPTPRPAALHGTSLFNRCAQSNRIACEDYYALYCIVPDSTIPIPTHRSRCTHAKVVMTSRSRRR